MNLNDLYPNNPYGAARYQQIGNKHRDYISLSAWLFNIAAIVMTLMSIGAYSQETIALIKNTPQYFRGLWDAFIAIVPATIALIKNAPVVDVVSGLLISPAFIICGLWIVVLLLHGPPPRRALYTEFNSH